MKKFRCKECQSVFDEEGEANQHVYEDHGNMEDAIEEFDTENLAEKPEETIQDAPEESPSDKGFTEDELMLNTIVENWDQLTEGEKAMIIERTFAKEKGTDEGLADKSDRNLFHRADGLLHKDISEGLAKTIKSQIKDSVEEGICPLCRESYSQVQFYTNLGIPKEELSVLKRTVSGSKDEIRDQRIRLVIRHMKVRHKSFETLKPILGDLFKIPVKGPNVLDPITSNPEHLSKEDIEGLSKEELSDLIGKDPELRRKLFKKWLLHLKKGERK